MAAERFPIMFVYRSDEKLAAELGCPSWISWSLLAPHEQQALKNHDQTLKRLAERGGLSPCEALAVLEDRPWHKMSDVEAIKALVSILDGR